MSTPRTRRSATLALFVALAAGMGVVTSGCKKGAGTIDPDGGAPVAGGIEFRYKAAPAKLKADAKFSFKLTSPAGVGEVGGDLTGLLDITAAGGDKLKIGLSIPEVRSFTVSKGMLPDPKEGEAPIDPKAAAEKFTGAVIADMRGDVDEEATKALPENAEQERSIADGLVAQFAGSVLGLPDLPKSGLVEGKTIETSERKDENINGLKLPVDSTVKWTLVKIDSSSGKRIGELRYESVSSGAVEQNQQLLTLDSESEGQLFFNLDDQLPVSRKHSMTVNIAFGDQGIEIVNQFEISYAPADA